MTKKDEEDFENSTKFQINVYVNVYVNVRGNCRITGKQRGSYCKIKVRLNHKIPTMFHNLNDYDSHRVMQELDKLDLKINLISNGLEKYMSSKINNKLIFIETSNF